MSYTAPVIPQHWHAITTRDQPGSLNITAQNSGAYPTADLAIYIPVLVYSRVVVLKLFAANGSAVSGNIDVGVYDATGTRLVSSGQVAQSGTTTEQVFDVTDTTIGPGLFYLAVVLNNTTGTLMRDSRPAPTAAAAGFLTEQLGTGAALPSTATWAVNQTLEFQPVLGMLIEGTVA